MKRHSLTPRPNWRARNDEVGFSFYDLPSEGDQPYWKEDVAYSFTMDEVELLEKTTKELFDRCMDAVEFIVRNDRFDGFGIPSAYHEAIKQSWDEDDPTVYGRFDFAYDGNRTVKMLEFNADTPTSLVESAAAQWQWLMDVKGKDADQFNSLHEQLIEQWRHIREERFQLPEGVRLHLASLHSTEDGELIVEDFDTIAYMAETAKLAGFDPKLIFVEDIARDVDAEQFVDADGEPIRHIFKLYPWEYMVHEQFAGFVLASRETTKWVEPLWKMLLSNKQLLVVLWELFPGHPNLLPAFDHLGPLLGREAVRKPRLGREGANVSILDARGNTTHSADGPYGEEGFIYQQKAAFAPIPGVTALIGSWVVGDSPAGIDMRETTGPITGDLAFFVPHYIEEAA